MIITTYNFDPVKKKEVEDNGHLWGQAEKLQFINGKYKIEENILTFTPDNPDKFETRIFTLIYIPKKQEIDYLKDENGNKYSIRGECSKPIISM